MRGNEFWRDLLVDAEKRGVLVDCGPNTFARNTVVPAIRSTGQSTPANNPPRKGSIKAKAGQVKGELIPLGPKASGVKKNPIKIDSDVEMRDVGDSSDSSSESDSSSDEDSSSDSSSAEEGEIRDVEMTDSIPNIPPVKRSQQPEPKRHPHLEPEIRKKRKAPKSPVLSKNNPDHRPPSKKDVNKSEMNDNSRKVTPLTHQLIS